MCVRAAFQPRLDSIVGELAITLISFWGVSKHAICLLIAVSDYLASRPSPVSYSPQQPHPQPRKPLKVSVKSHQLSIVLNSQGRQVGVGGEVACGACAHCQLNTATECFFMARAR